MRRISLAGMIGLESRTPMRLRKRPRTPTWGSAVAVGLAALTAAVVIAAPARAASGTWERAWGKDVVIGGGTGFEVCLVAVSCQQGSNLGGLGGELSNPNGVAVDPAGNVYVADLSNERIQKFDSSGNWERAWGKDVVVGATTGFEVCTAAASCKQGATGELGGELNFPYSVAADAAGNVYVTSNGRMDKFDSSGNFLRAWGTDVDTGGGTGFEVCTVAASCKAPSAGEGLGGELSLPTGVAADTAGNVYVADSANNRIQKFDSAGNWQRAWGKDVVTGGGTGFEVCTVAASCKQGLTGGLGGELNPPTGVATDAQGNVYVADTSAQSETSNQRIQKFDSSGNWQRAWGKDVVMGGGTGFEVCTVAASCQAGQTGGLAGELNQATGVAADAAGNVYVADQYNHRIQKFDSSGNWERAWGNNVDTDLDTMAGGSFDICTVAASCQAGLEASAGGMLFNPFGVTADQAGNVYVADTSNHRIQRYAEPQTLTVTVGGSGSGNVTGPGISCPFDDVCTAGYGFGASVTLDATPTSGTGSSFAGWGGACSGTGSSCQLTLDADKVVRATFNIPCGGTAPTIIGTNGNDVLSGTSARDVIEGLGGNDKLSGFAGSDLLCGGGGGDTLSGGKGKDKLYGEKGKDVLRGGRGKDKLKGGKGKDKLVQ